MRVARPSHGDCQPSRQVAREGATAAVAKNLSWQLGRTAPPGFGRVLVTAAGRWQLAGRAV
jgi:hypothetical protein